MSRTRLTEAEIAFLLGYYHEVMDAESETGVVHLWLRSQGAGGAEIDPLVRVLYAELGIPPAKIPPKPEEYEAPWENLEALRTRVKELKGPSP